MDFRLDDEQLALREAVRALCERHFDPARIANRESHAADPAAWSALADMGAFGFLVPAERGGIGGAVEAAVVCEQLGSSLADGPILWSAITAPLIPEAQSGLLRVAGAEAPMHPPVVIEHALDADAIVIVHDDRVEQCDASELSNATSGTPFDPLTPAAVYDSVPEGAVIGGLDDARRLRVTGTVLTAALLVGGAQGVLDVASTYALGRHQFGVPIGSFQAVKHILADMYVRAELARSATYAAAAIVDDERAGDATKAARTAKLLAGEAGIANGRAAVQVLGGMGFTWEMLPHYYLKRAWALEHAFGTGDAHALGLGDALGEEVTTSWT